MKTVRKAGLIAGAVMFSATQAAAQDAPSWEGFYLGAHAAYHHGEVDDKGCVGLCAHDHKVKEFYLAVQGGYDARVGENVIIGPMAWVGVTPVKDKAVLAPGIEVRGKTKFAGFVGARAGIESGNVLPYAFAGYMRVTGTIRNDAAPIKKVKGKHDGFGVGVGAEYRVASNVSVDARYMYSDLSDEDYNMGGGTTTAGEHAHTLSLGVNFRF
jgi:outer membrane autotransporter protein